MLESVSTSVPLKFKRTGESTMRLLKDQLKRFINEEAGQDIIEYALMVVLVALVVVGAVPNISQAVSGVFSKAISALG